jgi:hypothetical protein
MGLTSARRSWQAPLVLFELSCCPSPVQVVRIYREAQFPLTQVGLLEILIDLMALVEVVEEPS